MLTYWNTGDVEQTSSTTWKWTIYNYSNYIPVISSLRTKVISPRFSIIRFEEITNWHLDLFPNGQSDNSKNFLSVFLTNLEESDVLAKCEWSILNQTNGTVYVRPMLKSSNFTKPGSKSKGHSKFIGHEFINDQSKGALTDNTLILQCRIIIDNPKPNLVVNVEPDQLKDDFEKLLESEKHSDVTFVIGKKKMHLHKAILASRSPVFEGMFEHDMKENQQNTVKITDIKLKIMKELCRYIYAGKVIEINRIAKDLLIAADKYCIEELKIWCEKAICEQMNNDNALGYLQLATIYNAGYLKPRVYEFVTNHIKDLYEKPEYKRLDPEIKDEIMGIVIGVRSIQ